MPTFAPSDPVTGLPPFEACFRFAHNQVVSDSAIAEMGNLLKPVPHRLVQKFGFEIRLGDADERVDLFLGFDSSSPTALSEVAAIRSSLSRHQQDDLVWRSLGDFAKEWVLRGEFSDLQEVWVEYRATDIGWETPGVFVGRSAILDGSMETSQWMAACYRIIDAVSGHRLPSGIRRACTGLLHLRPAGVEPCSVAFFTGQPHPGIRLCLVGFSPSTLVDFLRSLKWVGDSEMVGSLVGDLLRETGIRNSVGIVHLDIGTSIQPRIGVELVFEYHDQVTASTLNSTLLGRLVDAGMCTPSKASALEDWPGLFFADIGPERLPQLFVRRVNHVKLVFDPTSPPEAKGYFGARMHLPPFFPTTHCCEPTVPFALGNGEI